MISSLRLRRFRGFRDRRIELKPLTVLLGPNSAGKSSFVHALASLHFMRRLAVTPPTLAPEQVEPSVWPFDFGKRETLQTTGTLDDAGVRIEVGVELDGAETTIAYAFGAPRFGSSLALTGLEIGRSVGLRSIPASSVLDPNVEGNGPLETITLPVAFAEAPDGQRTVLDEVALRRTGEQVWQVVDGESIVVGLENIALNHYTRRTGTLVTVASPAQKHLVELLGRLRYLRPSRANPQRSDRPRPDARPSDDVGPAGQWAGDTWLALKGRPTPWRAPPPARLDREAVQRSLAEPAKACEVVPFEVAVNRWLAHLRLGQSMATESDGNEVKVDVSVDGKLGRALPDVGHGLSQSLPVIVQGLALPRGGIFVVEQPEAELHPYPQAALADFFCSVVQDVGACLVETHSEAFFRRLHLRTMLDPDLASKVAVYFFDPAAKDGCCEPVPVPLEPEAALRWPKDFLSESSQAHGAYAAVRAVLARQAMR